jgi:glycosyltransferase involved in cell wall biosynthesis
MNHITTGTDTHRRPGNHPGTEGSFVPRHDLGHNGPRRILMTTSGRRTTWAHSLDLASALGRCGIEVVLASIGRAPSHVQLGEAAGLRNVQVFPNRFESTYSDDAWDEVERAGSWLLRMESMVQPDLVHLHSYPFGSLPFQAPTLLEGHDCPLCRSRATTGDTTALWERYRASVGQAMRATRMVVTPTRSALSELAGAYGQLPASRVIPIGRSTRGLAPATTKEDLILSAGCFGDEAQNLSALEAVARRLRWPVTVMVDGCPGPGVPEERDIKVLENPSSERLANWYGRASVFALPCSYEPAGLSVLEAALSGCALVLGDVPALRELWEGAALFVEPGSSDDLERALNLLMNEPKGLRGLGQRARARALLLSPERRAASFLEAYAHMLREPAAATMERQAS